MAQAKKGSFTHEQELEKIFQEWDPRHTYDFATPLHLIGYVSDVQKGDDRFLKAKIHPGESTLQKYTLDVYGVGSRHVPLFRSMADTESLVSMYGLYNPLKGYPKPIYTPLLIKNQGEIVFKQERHMCGEIMTRYLRFLTKSSPDA